MSEEKTEKEILEAIEEKAETELDKVFGDEPNPDESEESTSEQAEEETEEQTEETEESTSEKTDDSESKSESDSDETEETDSTDKTEDSEAGDESKLTQAEVRAAIHCKWSKEDIEELAKVNPVLAKKTCAKFLESTNNLSKIFSEFGKKQEKKESEAKVETKPEVKSESKSEKKAIDFTALEKEYEGDPIVGVLKQVVERNDTLANEVETLRSSGSLNESKVSNAQAQEDAAIAQQIDTFFNNPDIAAYEGVYGKVEKGSKDWDNLTQGQIKKRWSVVEQANLIMLGAQQQGMEMPIDEAFERAHLLTTEDVREQTIRKQIKSKAVKRGKSLSFAPNNPKKVANSGKKTKTEIESKAEADLKKVFG